MSDLDALEGAMLLDRDLLTRAVALRKAWDGRPEGLEEIARLQDQSADVLEKTWADPEPEMIEAIALRRATATLRRDQAAVLRRAPGGDLIALHLLEPETFTSLEERELALSARFERLRASRPL
jgi:hypothetical protein